MSDGFRATASCRYKVNLGTPDLRFQQEMKDAGCYDMGNLNALSEVDSLNLKYLWFVPSRGASLDVGTDIKCKKKNSSAQQGKCEKKKLKRTGGCEKKISSAQQGKCKKQFKRTAG